MERTVEVKDNEHLGKVLFLDRFNFTVSKKVKNGRIKLLCDRRQEIQSEVICYTEIWEYYKL